MFLITLAGASFNIHNISLIGVNLGMGDRPVVTLYLVNGKTRLFSLSDNEIQRLQEKLGLLFTTFQNSGGPLNIVNNDRIISIERLFDNVQIQIDGYPNSSLILNDVDETEYVNILDIISKGKYNSSKV